MLKNILDLIKFDPSQMTEKDLANRFAKTIILIVIVGVMGVLALFVFGPKFGSLFLYLSKNRNAKISKPTAKPGAPVFDNLPGAVGSQSIEIKGFALPGAKIELFVNGPKAGETLADAEGMFTFSDIRLNNGKNTVFAKATNENNIESERTRSYTIEVDKDPPDLELESLKDGDVIRNLDQRILVEGKVNEKAVIKINGFTAVQKRDNSFKFLLGVEEGQVGITIEVTDLADNKTIKELEVTYIRSSG